MTKMPDSQKLTAKQEKFCQAIVDGLNQSDAYRHVYDTGKMKPAVITNNDYMLMQQSDIAVRIQALRDQITASKAWSFERGMREIEANIELARIANQLGPARASTRDALEMSRLLEQPKDAGKVAITKVTVVLNHGKREPEPLDGGNVVEGAGRVLDPSEEELSG